MERRAYGVLGGKIERIKYSNVDPAWLAEQLLSAKIIGKRDVEMAKNADIPKPERRSELVEIVQGNGRRGVFQKFVIFFSASLIWNGWEKN